MKNKIFNNLGIKLLAIFMAIIIWGVIANIDDYIVTKQINNIEVEIINSDAITSKDKLFEVVEGQTIDVIVKGKRSIVDYMKSGDIKAVADLSKLSVTNAVQIVVTVVDSSIANDVNISCVDNMMIVNLEDKIDKQLPITVVTNGKPHVDYAVGNKTATPNMVTVTGPASLISKLQEAKVVVNVEGASSEITDSVAPKFYDGNGDLVDSISIECNVEDIDVTVEILKTKTVPVLIGTTGELQEGYELISVDYQPTELKLAGAPSELQDIENIEINDVDISSLDGDTEISVIISDYLPEGIICADGTEQIMIKIVIEKLKERSIEFKGSDITISGKDEAYDYTILDAGKLSVDISGLHDKIKDIDIKDIGPLIEVTGLKAGSYELEISFSSIDNFVIKNKIKVNIVIKEKEKTTTEETE